MTILPLTDASTAPSLLRRTGGSAIDRQTGDLHDRTDFDRPGAGQGDTGRDGNRLVHVLGLDEEVAAQLLPGLRKGTVGHERLAVADADAGSGGGRWQRRGRPV